MNNYMYGEDPAEAMDSAAARLALGERGVEMRSYPYGKQPWGTRSYTGWNNPSIHSAPPQAIDEYNATPTTGITPRTLEMLKEIRAVVRKFDVAVGQAAIERDHRLAAIYKDYNL